MPYRLSAQREGELMPRDQETTSNSVPVGTRTGTWPADATTTGPDDTNATNATNGGAFADRDVAGTRRDVTNADRVVTSPADQADDGYGGRDRTTAGTGTGVTDPAVGVTDSVAGVDADGATAREGRAGTSAGIDPSAPVPEDEWVAGSKGAFAATDASPVTDPAADIDPTRATVPDLGDPDLDGVPDAPASQSTGQSSGQSSGAGARGADTTRLDQPPTGAHAAPPAGTPGSAAGADAAFAAAGAALVTDADGYRASWVRIQSGFVDDPRGSVTEAADLITQITNTLVSAVQERERTLRGAWDGSGNADTENLRNALRDYRSFFERLIGA
jgi:hypothetical protein